MSVNPGNYIFPPVVRGDSFGELVKDEEGVLSVTPYRFRFDVNLDGCVAKMQFRSSPKVADAILSLSSDGTDPGIIIEQDGEDPTKWVLGIVPFSANFPAGTIYYDIEITTAGETPARNTFIKGTVPVINDVTK